MKDVEKEELLQLMGGATVSSAVINAFTNIIKVLQDAGKDLGSAIRRIYDGNLCSLE